MLARDNPDVNDAWIVRQGPLRVPARRRPDAAHDAARPRPGARAGVLRRGAAADGRRVPRRRVSAFLAGGRLLDEDAYALSKLARTVLGTNDLDHRRAAQARGRPGRARSRRSTARDASRYARPRARDGDPRGGPRRRAGGADPAPAAAQGRRPRRAVVRCCIRVARGCTTSPTHVLCRPATRRRLLRGRRGRRARRRARRAPRRRRAGGGRARRRAARARPRRAMAAAARRRRAVRLRHAPRGRPRGARGPACTRAAPRAAGGLTTRRNAARSRRCGAPS